MTRLLNWISQNRFYLLLWLAIFIFAVSVYFKVTQYLMESRFAAKDPIVFANGTKIRLIYPSVLEVSPPETASQQLALEMTGYRPDGNAQATVDLSKSNGLIFHDSEGNVASSIVILDISNSTNSEGLFMRAEPLVASHADQAKLVAEISLVEDGRNYSETESYNITIRDTNALAPLIGDIGIPLSLALAILGWSIDLRKRQRDEILKKEEQSREREAKERLEIIQSLRELAKVDSIEAMQRLIEYEKIQNLEESLKVVLKTLRQQFESREHLGELLYLAGESIERGDYQKTEQVLMAMDSYLCRVGLLDSKLVLPCLVEKPSISGDKEKIRALLGPTLQLWAKYDEYSRRVVVHIIHHICKTYKDDTEMMNTIKSVLNDIDEKHRKRLLRDPDIKMFAPELASFEKYDWAQTGLTFTVQEHSNTRTWLQLDDNRLMRNPFKLLSVEHLRSISPLPLHWDEIQSAQTMVISSGIEHDRELLMRYLESYLQADAKSVLNVFPVVVTLEPRVLSHPLVEQELVAEIINSIALAWVRLISKNPGVFLNLPRPQQYSIAEFLSWKAGSTASLQIWLRQHGLKDTFAGNMILRRVRELPDKIMSETITSEKVFEWIAIKPPDLDFTYILVDLRPGSNRSKQKAIIDTLFVLSHRWSGAKVALKIFSAPSTNLPTSRAQMAIEWELSALEKSLDFCTARAARDIPDLKFADLFWPNSYPEATRLVAQKSHGSLSEALRLGGTLIFEHVQSAPREPHLDISDLASIERI